MSAPAHGGGARFGVIGTGRMAALMMATFRAAGVEVRAIGSRDEQRARRFADAFGVSAAHGSWEGLLARSDIDAVYIANDAVDHAAATIAALEAGKAVLCEKPLAIDPVSAAQVLNAARLSGRLCMEGLWTSFLPAQRRFKDLVDDGFCGAPRHLHAEFGYPEPEGARLFRPEAGGVLLDRAVYLVALALQTLGPVANTHAIIDRRDDGVDHHAILTLDHAGGGRSLLAASFTSTLSNTATISGAGGLVTLGRSLPTTENLILRKARPGWGKVADTAPGPDRSVSMRLKKSAALRRIAGAMRDGRRERLSFGRDPYLHQLEHFLQLMASGRRESDVVPLDLSLEVLKIVQRAKTGQEAPMLKARSS